ncbi:hypothetical protein [Streptomyces sp. STR69]|uniref:hypothetical protein n=1 Tax=Streptomyces sp. STR69 TaxID=1796942 RepID=UPI0021C97665|nr:hypothetical protein [Streptomyces sp. STR69]
MTDVTRPNGDTSDESSESSESGERKGASTDTQTGKGAGTGTGAGTSTGTGTGTGMGAGMGTERREATTVTPIPRQTDRQDDRQTDRPTDRPTDRTAPVHAPEPPPAPVATAADKRHDRLDAGNGSLLPHDESDKFSLRLQHAVTGFVDEPRSAVEEAAHVLEEVADRLTQAVTKRRDTLHGSWESKGSDDTEQLRLALRDYRELTERLLHI